MTNNIDEIFVATDCEEIKNVVNSFNFSKVKVYDRDEENARFLKESAVNKKINKASFFTKSMEEYKKIAAMYIFTNNTTYQIFLAT